MTSFASSVITADSFHALLSQPDGRDKILRLIQYVCKMLRWLDPLQKATKSEFSDTAAAIEGALSTSRQAGRLFKWASMYVKLRGRREFSSDITLLHRTTKREDLLSLVSDIAMFSYYITDNITFSSKLGLIQADTPKLSRRGARLWLTSVIAGLSLSLLQIYTISQRIRMMKKIRIERLSQRRNNIRNDDEVTPVGHDLDDGSDNELRAQLDQTISSRRNRLLITVKQACDFSVACNGSFDVGMNQSFIGLCGTISSAIGLAQIWPSSS